MNREDIYVYLFTFFRYFSFMGGVFTIFLLDCGLNFFQISLFIAVTSISVAIFEIPTGLIADRYSRKWAIFFGELIGIVFWLSVIFIRNFAWFMVWAFLSGVSYSLVSSAFVSMVYDNLKSQGREDEFKKIQANYRSIAEISMFAGGVLSGFVASISFSVAIALTVIAYLIGLLFLILIRECRHSRKEKKEKIIENFKNAYRYIKERSALGTLIILLVYVNVILVTVLPYMQAYIYFIIPSLPVVSIIASLIDLSSVGGYKIAYRFDARRFLNYSPFVVSGLIILIGVYHTLPSLIFLAIAEVIGAAFYVVWQSEFQKNVPSSKRALLTSFAYTAVTFSLMVFYFVYGYVIDLLGLYKAILYVSVFLTIVYAVYYFANLRIKGIFYEN
ncbi:MAG: MFS transporter [Euryarchaeota archaeon]|nr:MFS transporter [Euryarchaeota archaeon]